MFLLLTSKRLIFAGYAALNMIKVSEVNNEQPKAMPDKVIAVPLLTFTSQQMKFSMKEFFSNCDQIHRSLCFNPF